MYNMSLLIYSTKETFISISKLQSSQHSTRTINKISESPSSKQYSPRLQSPYIGMQTPTPRNTPLSLILSIYPTFQSITMTQTNNNRYSRNPLNQSVHIYIYMYSTLSSPRRFCSCPPITRYIPIVNTGTTRI